MTYPDVRGTKHLAIETLMPEQTIWSVYIPLFHTYELGVGITFECVYKNNLLVIACMQCIASPFIGTKLKRKECVFAPGNVRIDMNLVLWFW